MTPRWSKMVRRCVQDAQKWFMLETPLGERSERASAAREASGAIRMNSRGLLRKSISKDAFRVREGCFRKAIQIVSPRGFILNALPVLLLTPGLCWDGFSSQNASKTPPRRCKTPQDAPRRPKTPPRRPKTPPRRPKTSPRRPKLPPRGPQETPKSTQDGHKSDFWSNFDGFLADFLIKNRC